MSRWQRLREAWNEPEPEQSPNRQVERVEQHTVGPQDFWPDAKSGFGLGATRNTFLGMRSAFGFAYPSKEEARTIPTYSAVLGTIARLIGQMPLKITRTEGKNRSTYAQALADQWNLGGNGQLLYGPDLTQWAVRQYFEEGNACIYVEQDPRWGGLGRLRNVDYSRVNVRLKDAPERSSLFPTEYQISQGRNGRGGTVTVDGSSVLHFMYEVNDGVRGESILHNALRNIIQLALEQEMYAADAYSKDPTSSYQYTVSEGMTQEEKDSVRKEWDDYLGRAGRKELIIAEGGGKFEQLLNNLNAGQIIEPRRWVAEEICRAFNSFPPSAVALGKTNILFTSGKHYRVVLRSIVSNVLQPITAEFANEIRAKFFPPDARIHVEFDPEVLISMDRAELVDLLAKEVDAGLSTVNEARAQLGREAMKGGDTLRTRSRFELVPMEDTSASEQEQDEFEEEEEDE